LFNKDWVLCRYPQGKKSSKYVIPEKTVSIMKYAFAYCNSLKNIVFPEGLKFIEEAAFAQCWGLSEITLPDSLLYIGEKTFMGCENLKTITLSKKTKMGRKALEDFEGQLVYRD
jgi:hypothetical protein